MGKIRLFFENFYLFPPFLSTIPDSIHIFDVDKSTCFFEKKASYPQENTHFCQVIPRNPLKMKNERMFWSFLIHILPKI